MFDLLVTLFLLLTPCAYITGQGIEEVKPEVRCEAKWG